MRFRKTTLDFHMANVMFFLELYIKFFNILYLTNMEEKRTFIEFLNAKKKGKLLLLL